MEGMEDMEEFHREAHEDMTDSKTLGVTGPA